MEILEALLADYGQYLIGLVIVIVIIIICCIIHNKLLKS